MKDRKFLTVDEQFQKTLNDEEISRIEDIELRELRMKHWIYRTMIFKDEHNISDAEFCRLSDNDYALEEKELQEYRKRKGI